MCPDVALEMIGCNHVQMLSPPSSCAIGQRIEFFPMPAHEGDLILWNETAVRLGAYEASLNDHLESIDYSAVVYGEATTIFVPLFRPLVRLNLAPICSARSRIPLKPKPS